MSSGKRIRNAREGVERTKLYPLGDAVKLLDKDVAKRRKELLGTIEWSADEVPKQKHQQFVRAGGRT